jgi:hypothetical protein
LSVPTRQPSQNLSLYKKGETMRRPAALFPILLILGALVLAPAGGARADAPREGPIEIEKCQTIDQPGSYKLVNNLTLTGTAAVCLQITANFVTLDLAGFTISRLNAGFPSGTTAIAAGDKMTGITVRNGSISGFSVGVGLEGNGSIVEGLRVDGLCPCDVGIAANGIVRGNIVSVASEPDGSIGILASGIVTGNYVFHTRSTGMDVGQGSTVIGNTVTDTGGIPGVGLRVTCPSNVTNNTAVNNMRQNLVLEGTGCNDTNNVAP